MQSLTELQQGEKGVVSAINGDTHFQRRITSIGLTIGCPVEVLKNEKRQPVLIYGRDTMIAINRKEGENIMLEANA